MGCLSAAKRQAAPPRHMEELSSHFDGVSSCDPHFVRHPAAVAKANSTVDPGEFCCPNHAGCRELLPAMQRGNAAGFTQPVAGGRKPVQPHLIGSCRGKDSPPGRAHRAGSPLLAGGAPALVTAEPDSPTLYCESVSYQHGAYSVQGRLRSAAPAELVYQVLTDYHALASVFHNVDDCHVTQTEEGERLLVQTVNWHFLIFRGSFVTELLVDEGPDLQLSFSLLRSAFMRQFIGSWEVTAAEGGGSDIRHSLSIVPTLSPPQKIGDLTKSIFVSQVEGILGDLAAELDTRAAQQAQQQQEAGARETERASPRER